LPLVAQNKQPPSAPKYDLQAETKLKGTIEEVRLPPKGSEKEIAYLLVKSGADTVDVYLCPQSFLAEMGVSFNKGDEISLTGSKVKQGEAALMLAREVVRGNEIPWCSETRRATPSGAGAGEYCSCQSKWSQL
jgi:hypothetical protein